MEIIIKGEAKEIAALVLEIQERRGHEIGFAESVAQTIRYLSNERNPDSSKACKIEFSAASTEATARTPTTVARSSFPDFNKSESDSDNSLMATR